MASRSFHDLLLRARDELATASHRGHAVVVVLLALHLVVVAPFADADRRQAALESERRRLAEVAPAIDQLAERLESAARPAIQAMSPGLTRLVEGVRGDLERLEATRWRLREAGDSGEGANEPALAMRPPSPGTEPMTLADDELAALARADNRYALLTVLEPIIERTVVEPRFADAQRRWQEVALPALTAELETITAVVPRLRARFDEASAEWGTLERALSDLRQTAETLRFAPPERPYWWASPETAEVFELGIDAATAEALSRPRSLEHLANDAAEVRDRIAGLRDLLRARIERAQGSEGELGRGLAALGIDLAGAIPFFPLALGLLVAVVLLRRGQRLRQLALAVRYAVDHGAPDALRLWCLAELSSHQRSELSVSAAERRAQGRILGVLVLAWVWLGLAGWQLHGPPAERSPEWLPTLLGAAAVLLAAVQRLLVAQGSCELLRHEGPGDEYYFRGPVDDYDGPIEQPVRPGDRAAPEPVVHDVSAPESVAGPVTPVEPATVGEPAGAVETVVPLEFESSDAPDSAGGPPIYRHDEPSGHDEPTGTGDWADAGGGLRDEGRAPASLDDHTIAVEDEEENDLPLDGSDSDDGIDTPLRR